MLGLRRSIIMFLPTVLIAACGSPGRAGDGATVTGRPACAPPEVTLTVPTPIPSAVGQGVAISATVHPAVNLRVLSLRVIVARPGTTADTAPSSLSTSDELAVAALADFVPAGQHLELIFTPPAPGTFPIFMVTRYVATPDCSSPPPADSGPIVDGVVRLGEVAAG